MVKALTPHKVVANELINLTGNPFAIYDTATGIIWEFPANSTDIAKRRESKDEKRDYFVINKTTIDQFISSGCTLKNVCFIVEEGAGRNSEIMSRLALASDLDTEVCIKCYSGRYGVMTDK